MTVAVLLVQGAVQSLVAHGVATRTWWTSEWVRLQLQLAQPKAPYVQHPAPAPSWRDWVPSATTAVLVTAALVLLALLVARVGRGWWLLAVAALPLLPAELAPGVWAPPLSNQVAYALVWPAGATEPQTAWAWISAAITAVLVAVPAAALAVTRTRQPWASPGLVLGRLAPVGLVAAAWLGWQSYAGHPADVLLASWRTILVVVGALAMTGVVRRGQVLLVLVVLPAFAAGAVRWTTTADGVPTLVLDPAAWWMSAAAVAGGVYAAWLQPRLARALRSGRLLWSDALHAGEDEDELEAEDERQDDDAHDATLEQVAEHVDEGHALEDLRVPDVQVPDDASGLEPVLVRIVVTDADEPASATVSRRRGRGASGRSGGRHRA